MPLLQDCLAALLSLRGPIPRRFIFLDAPAGLSDPTVIGMLRNRADVVSIPVRLQEFCNAAAELTAKPVQILSAIDAPKKLEGILAQYTDTIGVPAIKLPDDFVA